MADTKNELTLREAGLPLDAFSDHLKAQLAHLSTEEVNALVSIKKKLNANLSPDIRRAADTIGGFVW